jgi:hypothetical protein
MIQVQKCMHLVLNVLVDRIVHKFRKNLNITPKMNYNASNSKLDTRLHPFVYRFGETSTKR